MYSKPFGMFSAALLAGLFVAGCSSKGDGVSVVNSGGASAQGGEAQSGDGGRTSGVGGTTGQAGNSLVVVPSDAGSEGEVTASAGAYPTTLPPGFTAADGFGGYRLGEPITIDDETGSAGSGGSTSDETASCGTTILAVIRDFQRDNKNFEGEIGDDRMLVEPVLGKDRKPVLAAVGPTLTLGDPAQF